MIKGTEIGVAGTGTTGAMGFVAWLTVDGLPIVHALAALGTAFVGFATGIYYIVKLVKLRREK